MVRVLFCESLDEPDTPSFHSSDPSGQKFRLKMLLTNISFSTLQVVLDVTSVRYSTKTTVLFYTTYTTPNRR